MKNEINWVNAHGNTEIIQLKTNITEIIQIRRPPQAHPLQFDFKV